MYGLNKCFKGQNKRKKFNKQTEGLTEHDIKVQYCILKYGERNITNNYNET